MSSVNLTWDADGNIDSYNIYRSEATMDVNSLPAPLATGITAKSYSDTTAISGKDYYYRVASVKNEVEKISSEIKVASGDLYFSLVDALIFADGSTFVDSSLNNRTISVSGDASLLQSSLPVQPIFDDGLIFLNGGNLASEISPILNNKFTTELFFYAKPDQFINQYPFLINISANIAGDRFSSISCLLYKESNTNIKPYMLVNGSAVVQPSDAFKLLINGWNHIVIDRDSTNINLKLNGNLVGSYATTASFNYKYLTIGKTGTGDVAVGYLNSIRHTALTTRYANSYTVPMSKF